MLTALIVSTLTALVPIETVAEDRAELIEWNHLYNQRGEQVFQQIIFWEVCDRSGALRVMAWRLLKSPAQIPLRDWQSRSYTAIWHDGEVLRKVSAPSARQTWTQHDPELDDRHFRSTDRRRGLIRSNPPTSSQPLDPPAWP